MACGRKTLFSVYEPTNFATKKAANNFIRRYGDEASMQAVKCARGAYIGIFIDGALFDLITRITVLNEKPKWEYSNIFKCDWVRLRYDEKSMVSDDDTSITLYRITSREFSNIDGKFVESDDQYEKFYEKFGEFFISEPNDNLWHKLANHTYLKRV